MILIIAYFFYCIYSVNISKILDDEVVSVLAHFIQLDPIQYIAQGFKLMGPTT